MGVAARHCATDVFSNKPVAVRDYAPPGLTPGYDNTWRTLKAKGQPFPFIIDMTPPAVFEP